MRKKGPNVLGIRANRFTLQKQMAMSLHKQTQVPLNRMADADALQRILSKESIQLNIFSFNHMNSFIYHGGNHQNQSFKTKIYIKLLKKHYSSILSLAVLLSKSYYCEKCLF